MARVLDDVSERPLIEDKLTVYFKENLWIQFLNNIFDCIIII